MTLTSGSILEKRHRIEAKLGEGGFGAASQATDSRLYATCAIREAPRQFKREAEMPAKLHRSCAQVWDYT